MRTLRRRAVRSGSVAIVIIATLVAVGMAAGDAVATSGPGDSVSGGFEDDFGERVGLERPQRGESIWA
jgi:hypothetical protein